MSCLARRGLNCFAAGRAETQDNRHLGDHPRRGEVRVQGLRGRVQPAACHGQAHLLQHAHQPDAGLRQVEGKLVQIIELILALLAFLLQREKWLKFNHIEATIMEALVMLNDLVDESDPDIALPNIVHAFQVRIPYAGLG